MTETLSAPTFYCNSMGSIGSFPGTKSETNCESREYQQRSEYSVVTTNTYNQGDEVSVDGQQPISAFGGVVEMVLPMDKSIFIFDSRKYLIQEQGSRIIFLENLKLFSETLQRLNIKIPYLAYSDVMSYLMSYSDITDILIDACRSAKNEFPSPTRLSLEMFYDPESDDKYITLYVRQEDYEANILERIEKISEKYYDLLGETRGWFIINTDFSRP